MLDLGAYFAGPFAPRLLADLGTDVIKLEPLAGDQLRGLFRPFAAAQRGKRAVALDLKDRRRRRWECVSPRGCREAQHATGAAERIGLGYEQVREVNPDVVYVYGPGWGSTGPDRMRQSFAPMLSGYVGANYEVAGAFNPPLFTVGNEDPGADVEHILCESDYPHSDTPWPNTQAAFKALFDGVPQDEVELMTHRNAERLVDFPLTVPS